MKKFVLGFLTAALLFSALPIGAAVQQYILQPSTSKITLNGVEIKDKLPILDYNGTDYIPESVLQSVCDKIKVGFKQSTSGAIQLTTASTTTSAGVRTMAAQTRPAQPNETLGIGMEWVWYEEGSFAGWCVKYNSSTYVHEQLLDKLGYNSTIKLNKDKIGENIIETNDHSKYIQFNRKDTNQCIYSSISRYVNLDWIKENI